MHVRLWNRQLVMQNKVVKTVSYRYEKATSSSQILSGCYRALIPSHGIRNITHRRHYAVECSTNCCRLGWADNTWLRLSWIPSKRQLQGYPWSGIMSTSWNWVGSYRYFALQKPSLLRMAHNYLGIFFTVKITKIFDWSPSRKKSGI